MLTEATCRNATHVLLLLNLIVFGGALASYAIVVVALRWRRLRRCAADPFHDPFGDQPPVDHLRAFMGRRR